MEFWENLNVVANDGEYVDDIDWNDIHIRNFKHSIDTQFTFILF